MFCKTRLAILANWVSVNSLSRLITLEIGQIQYPNSLSRLNF